MESTRRAGNRRILLCVDISYQSYRAAASHPMLTCGRTFTGGLYGFFMTFGKIVRETRATDVAFCLDSKPYKRSEIYPEYKQLRKQAADEELLKMHKQTMRLLQDTFSACGLQTWGISGFESDDLIGHAVLKYRHRFDRIYAASNDSDLFQLLDVPNFFIYTKDIASVWTADLVMKTHGLTPQQYMLATALTGTHNDIAGISGVGLKTALKIIKDPAMLHSYKDKHGAMIDRNLKLIKLPHPELPASASLPAHATSFNPRKLYNALGQYDIDVTTGMVQAFEQLLKR